MLPFLNRTQPPSSIAAAAHVVEQCARPLNAVASVADMVHKTYKAYKAYKGDSPEKKEKTELRRLNIESHKQMERTREQQGELSQLRIQQLKDGADVNKRGGKARLRRLKIDKLHEENKHLLQAIIEEGELRRLDIKRRKKEPEYRNMEAELCKLKIQQLRSPNNEETELRRQKLQLLQESNVQESQLRRLKIEKLRSPPNPEEITFRNLQLKLMARQLKEYDDAADARQRAEEALERYRELKIKFQQRASQRKRKRGDDNWSENNKDTPTPIPKKRRLRNPFPTVPRAQGPWTGGIDAPVNTPVGDRVDNGGIAVSETSPVGTMMSVDGDVTMEEGGTGTQTRGFVTPPSRVLLPTPPDSQDLFSFSGSGRSRNRRRRLRCGSLDLKF